MIVPNTATNPSPLAGEGGPERSEGPGEGKWQASAQRIASPPRPSPAALRAAPFPARGKGKSGGGPQDARARTARAGEGKSGGAAISPLMRSRARALRQTMTDAERKLWYALRDRRFAGVKFRRQVPLGPFIADFVCFEERLVIEVDGGQHAESLRDRGRDRWFAANGFRVLRFWNNQVLSNLEGVATVIAQTLKVLWS
jgi:very-short-patch-repair endonuclease